MLKFVNRLERATFYLALFFLPTQLGKHFWPEFSYIYGVRIDYLSPTLYLTDILIIALFSFLLSSVLIKIKQFTIRPAVFDHWKLGLFVAILLIGIAFSKSPMVGWYGLLKLTEFSFFGVYTVNFLNSKQDFLTTIAIIFSFSTILESLLAIAQFVNKGSLNGIFYWLGERSFNSQTPNIANANINGSLILRPYATFSHPNVLAGFLLISLIIICFAVIKQKRENRPLFLFSMFIGTIALLLTLSRVALVIYLLLFFYLLFYLLQNRAKTQIAVIFLFLTTFALIIFFSPVLYRFATLGIAGESFQERLRLTEASFLMLKDSPFFGVGLNNFLVNLPRYSMVGKSFFYVQPVHDIFLLIAAQTGIAGLLLFFWFLAKTHRRIISSETKTKRIKDVLVNYKFIILTTVLILGLFDHYFLTIQQGQMLTALILAIGWAKKPKEKSKKRVYNRLRK